MSNIRYLIMENPDDRDLKLAAKLLSEGKLVALPSDTNWVIVCHPFVAQAVESLYRWKGERQDHHFSLLCRDISQASEVALIEDRHFRYMRSRVPGHYTFIFKANKLARKSLKASHIDHQIGVRIPPCSLFHALARHLDVPLLSTNILPAMLGVERAHDIYSLLIEEEWPEQIALVLDPGEYQFSGPSTVIDCTQEEVVVVREGAGEVD